MKKIAIVPSLFTLGNGICGFASITCAAKVGSGVPAPGDLDWLALAGWLIFAAMAFDVLDGYMARFAKSTTDFGGQLDSLCDCVSFGVAPAFLLLCLCAEFPERWLWVIASLFVVCVLLRLARFNCQNTHELSGHLVFRGLPTPAAAGALAAFAITFTDLVDAQPALAKVLGPFVQGFLPFYVLVLALLMVSRIPYPHVVNQILRGYHSFGHLVRLVFALVVILLIRELALPLLLGAFVLGAPLRYVWEGLVLRKPRKELIY